MEKNEKTKESKGMIITTSTLRPAKKREKNVLIQTHDLPSPLPIQKQEENVPEAKEQEESKEEEEEENEG